MRKALLIYAILICSCVAIAQDNGVETAFWKLTSLNGNVDLKGIYFNQDILRNSFSENISHSFITAGLFFNTKSYFWHPNFMAFDLDAGYSPETGQQLSLVAPDRSEVNTLKKLNTSLILFQHNKLNLKFYSNLHQGYSSRENLTNIKSTIFDWGSIFTYANKVVPITISYNHNKNKQLEIDTDNQFQISNSSVQALASKSFGKKDSHLLSFTQNNYTYNNQFLIDGVETYGEAVHNEITGIRLKDNLFFDKKKNYRFTSLITNETQNGSYFTYKRFQINENLSFKLPKKFFFSTNYSYFDIETKVEHSKQHFIRGELSNQLYESLRSRIYLEFNNLESTQFHEQNQRTGFNINYLKKIPFKGLLSISYNLQSNLQKRESENQIVFILNEEHVLIDSQMTLLVSQNIAIESVIVKDETGTIIYQQYFDYLLIIRNELIEIQRVPGGRIADNSLIFVDYNALQPGSYQFNAIHSGFTSSIALFENKIEFYFKMTNQDYIQAENISYLTLDYFNQKVFGCRINIKFFTGGIEQDYLNSTIIPYRLTRYFFVIQGSFKQKLQCTVNANVRDYQMIIQEGTKQQYNNFSGTASYAFNQKTKLTLHGNYLMQKGNGIDINLFSSRLEFSTRFLQIFIKASAELYKNKTITEHIDYKKFAIQISRKF